jgi:hypothetical protein
MSPVGFCSLSRTAASNVGSSKVILLSLLHTTSFFGALGAEEEGEDVDGGVDDPVAAAVTTGLALLEPASPPTLPPGASHPASPIAATPAATTHPP